MKKIISIFNDIDNKYLYAVIIFLIVVILIIMGFSFKKESVVVNDLLPLESEEEIKEEQENQEEKSNIKVDIKGAVNNPGVYELEINSRVIDAINKAGGLLENADTTLINLSKNLKDEMTIIIYTKEEIEKYKESKKQIEYVYIEVEKCPDKINDACIIQNNDVPDTKDKENAPDKENTSDDENTQDKKQDSASKENNEQSTLVSINNATKEELQTVSGIGKTKAEAIISYRNQNGAFKTIEDIKNVKGIGDALFEKIKDFITI